uniref:Putative AAAP amino acid permease n=1 Tax=Moniliophthora roreri TaxID=221103 RepID=A0A0W0FV04_MONRR
MPLPKEEFPTKGEVSSEEGPYNTPPFMDLTELEESNQQWIAIAPQIRNESSGYLCADSPKAAYALKIAPGNSRFNRQHNLDPPTFAESQFDIILRRQRVRHLGERALKTTAVPSRFLNLTNEFEFAGWGTFQKLQLEPEDRDMGEKRVKSLHDAKILGQFTASALAGNAVLGSVFYALPAVVAVATVYTPISLFIAAMTLFLWRPIMSELSSALPTCGAPYSYLLNVSSKSLAIVGASILLLDFGATSVVSAATAASYLAGEVSLPFPQFVAVVVTLAAFTLISLSGIKESARLALCVLTTHVVTMVVLMIAAFVHWGRTGNTQLEANWSAGSAHSGSTVAKQIFNGFCLGVLGLTGFECVPAYIARIKPGRLPLVLRNLHYPAIIFTTILSLLSIAIVPLDIILAGANVLSVLAELSAGRWLRIWVATDAMVVLCGGVLTGILSACELFEQLAHDRILPNLFLRVTPVTKAPWISILSFVGFCAIIYSSTSASLTIVSKMFSLVWLGAMSLFPISLLLLKFNRGRLPRDSQYPLTIVLLALTITFVVVVGNIYIDPTTAGYFAAYFIAILLMFSVTQSKLRILRWVYWIYDQYPCLHRCIISRNWEQKFIDVFTRSRRHPVCVLVKSDEINYLFRMMLYVSRYEETSCVKIVHFLDEEAGVPSELEANAKILDEAFPEITVDLIIVQASFEPRNVAALAHRLKIPTSLMFMSCPGEQFPYPISDLGTRIITL